MLLIMKELKNGRINNDTKIGDMKNKIEENGNEKLSDLTGKKLTRKEAIRKSGYLAISAATMMILLSNPNKAMAASVTPPPHWP